MGKRYGVRANRGFAAYGGVTAIVVPRGRAVGAVEGMDMSGCAGVSRIRMTGCEVGF